MAFCPSAEVWDTVVKAALRRKALYAISLFIYLFHWVFKNTILKRENTFTSKTRLSIQFEVTLCLCAAFKVSYIDFKT